MSQGESGLQNNKMDPQRILQGSQLCRLHSVCVLQAVSTITRQLLARAALHSCSCVSSIAIHKFVCVLCVCVCLCLRFILVHSHSTSEGPGP